MKKRLIAAILTMVCVLGALAGCGGKKVDAAKDLESVKEKGKLVIGITLYEPMNFYDDKNVLTGFDTEYAEAVCKEMGIKAEFIQINWDNKEFELNSGNIDCIWNGFTIDDERKQAVDFTTPYVTNRQVIVVKKDNLDSLKDVASYKDVSVCFEKGSAGEKAVAAKLEGCKTIPVAKQVDALMEVKAGTSKAAALDYTLASSMVGEGTDYADLVIVESIELPPEQYGIGCRKGSSLVEEINKATKKLMDDGTLQDLADKYEVNLTK